MATRWSVPSADDPAQALATVVALRTLADRLESDAVAAAISQGWSWTRVAQALGITKQGAHKKFAHLISERGAR